MKDLGMLWSGLSRPGCPLGQPPFVAAFWPWQWQSGTHKNARMNAGMAA
jgi:hypothetical protein